MVNQSRPETAIPRKEPGKGTLPRLRAKHNPAPHAHETTRRGGCREPSAKLTSLQPLQLTWRRNETRPVAVHSVTKIFPFLLFRSHYLVSLKSPAVTTESCSGWMYLRRVALTSSTVSALILASRSASYCMVRPMNRFSASDEASMLSLVRLTSSCLR